MTQYQQPGGDTTYQQQYQSPAPGYAQGQIPPAEKPPYPQQSTTYPPSYSQQSMIYPQAQGRLVEKPTLPHPQSYGAPLEKPQLTHHQSYGPPFGTPGPSHHHPYGSPIEKPPLAHHQSFGLQSPTHEQHGIPASWTNRSYNGPLDIVETHSAPPPQYAEMQMQIEPIDKGFAGLAPEKLQFETQPLDQSRSAFSSSSPVTSPGGVPPKTADDIKHGKMKRFVGDTLVGRFARASMTSASTSFKIGGSLSPWGDNNPVVLPNVRYRDAVSFVVCSYHPLPRSKTYTL
jgi:hypothetical protein